MIEKRGIEDPDLGEIASIDNPGKTEQTKQATKKKSSAWPWIIAGVTGLGMWYMRERQKKKELAEVQERARIEAETQPQDRILPPVAEKIVLPVETSAQARLRGMGVNPDIPSPYQSDESYKEL